MATCRLCAQHLPTLVAYFDHFRFHSSIVNGAICPSESCCVVLKSYSSLRCHVLRHHKTASHERENVALLCPVSSCDKILATRSELVLHIAEHLDGNTDAVTCPFAHCVSVSTSAASFRTHVSRYHRQEKDALQCSGPTGGGMEPGSKIMQPLPENKISASFHAAEGAECSQFLDRPMELESDSFPSTSESEHVDDAAQMMCSERNNHLFIDNFSLFLLKLESQHHLPATTVQNIVKEIQNLHSLNKQMLLQQIAKKVPSGLLPDVKSCFSEDLLEVATSDTLRSTYCRHKYYKERFCFLKPTELLLGLNKQNQMSAYHYVPIDGLVHFLMSSLPFGGKSFVDETCDDSQLCHSFRNLAENEIGIILYLDDFEIVNPLGSSKGNFKLLGVYMTLNNLPLYYRSRVNNIQLVMLCRQKDVKQFGLTEVLRPLTDDMVLLEKSGVTINGAQHTVRLNFVVGDNLASHAVGGFTQNFSSSTYFCRYCLITRCEFEQKPHAIGARRTVENYNESLKCLEKAGTGSSDFGIVGNSPFHVLKHYHVCNSGLPPCIAHDLFEGVVRHDLALCINYFVKNKNWFTYDYLNNRIVTMKYTTNDMRNKPAKVPTLQVERLVGHAIQNWTFLRLLPLYVGTKVVDVTDSIWQLVVLLANIVDLLMAPKITPAQVAHLKVLTEDYITSRSALFPLHKIRPKHHYMLHYSELIQQFGPLSHVWTLKFESKHQYFKQCTRSTRNFKNITKTLSERHQLCQAFQAAKGSFALQPEESTDMSISERSTMLSRVGNIALPKSTPLKKATVNGFVYTCNDYILISGTRYDVTFGCIVGMFKHDGMYLFLVECKFAYLEPSLCLYMLQEQSDEAVLVQASDLLDCMPYVPYFYNGKPVIRLMSSFPERLC